jgi:DnaJ-class molecular chaperone
VREVKLKVFCPRCEGKRKMLMKRYPEGQGMAWVVCPECNGHGWIEVVFIEDAGGKVFIP